ncbi:hypothetical protein AVEN_46319-1, partial [Araneus ventricosus]
HDSPAHNDSISTKVVNSPHVGLVAVDTTLSPDEDSSRITLRNETSLIYEE